MRFLALILAIATVFPTSVFADESCPLSNPAYKGLRAAASALEQKIMLPQGCETIEKKLNDANQQLSAAAQSVANFAAQDTSTAANQDPANSTAGDEAQKQLLASEVTQSVGQIGDIFETYGRSANHCGKALISLSDYITAFIDTVTQLSPMMLAFGGSSALPEVLGATMLGSAVKTFMVYIDGLSVDMSTSQAREAFIENACGYYRFNETLRSLLQTLNSPQTDLDAQIAKLKKEIKQMEADSPKGPKLTPVIAAMVKAQKADQEQFKSFTTLFNSASANPALACILVRTQIEQSNDGTSFPAGAIQRLDELVKMSKDEGRPPTSDELLVLSAKELGKADLYNLDDKDSHSCAARAKDWVGLIQAVLAANERELDLPGRTDFSKTPQGDAQKVWNAWHKKFKDRLTGLEKQQKLVKLLSQSGEQIELSELLDTRDHIRRELFGNGDDSALLGMTHVQGPAESWLKHKWREAGIQLKDYESLMPLFRQNWLDRHVVTFTDERQKEFACAYAENAVLTLGTAIKHDEASRLFCDTFDQTINEATHPYVTQYCLGSFDSSGRRTSMGWVEERSNEVNVYKPEMDRILAWGKDAGCKIPPPLQGDVLN